jgi:uncharacterized protein HemX
MTSLEVAEKAADAATGAMNNLVKDGVLGALLVLAVVGIVILVWRLLRAQDLRVEDQNKANDALEKVREKTSTLMEQLMQASHETTRAMERLTDAQEDNVRALDRVCSALTSVQTTLESVLRDAVRGRGDSHTSTSSSSRHEVRPGSYSLTDPKDEKRRG